MINETALQIVQIVLFTSAAGALASALLLHLIKVKTESRNFDLAAKPIAMPVPRVRVATSQAPIRSFVPKIVGANKFKQSAQIKFQQARVTSQKLMAAMREEMAKHGITPPDETPA
jgi:hypothetical protein